MNEAIAAVVLAAGRSSRMGRDNKLITMVDGKPLIAHAIDAACASSADPVIVVLGHEDRIVKRAIGDRSVDFVLNPDYAVGLSTSVRCGVAAVPMASAGAVFLAGDTPRVRAAHVDMLITAFLGSATRPICIAAHRGRRGHPVLWPSRYFPKLRTLCGDEGGRQLFGTLAEDVLSVEMPDAEVFQDIDTPADVRAARDAMPSDPDQLS